MTARNLRVLFLALFSWVFGFGLYDDLFPLHARALGATPVQLGILFTVRQLTITAGSILGGVLSDRYGRRAVLLPSWILAAPVPLIFVAAPSWGWLLPGIFLYDITIFGLPALNAYVADYTAPDRIASTFATLTAASSLALLFAPALGGLVAARWGIRASFALAFVCYTVSTLFILRTDPERAAPRAPRAWGQALRFWDLQGHWPTFILLGVIAGAPLALAPFISPFLREVRGLGLAQIGVLGSILSGGGLLFTLASGRAADRWGQHPMLVATLLLTAAGALVVAYGPLYLLPAAFLVKSRSTVQSLSQAVVAARVPAESAGRAFGLLGMATGLVGALGTILAGVAYRVAPPLPLAAGAGLMTVVAGLLLLQRGAPVRAPAVE